MSLALLLTVRFHDGRYHGAGNWPPSPARLFQALLAGAAQGNGLPTEDRDALLWLETQKPPLIAAPIARDGRGFKNYVPNNDLDAVGGDLGRIGEIRAPKLIRPRLFDARETLLYVWQFDGDPVLAETVCRIADRLYQLGRGVDMAWATGDILDEIAIEERLAGQSGVLHQPTERGGDTLLLCPEPGSLASLEARFNANRKRLTTTKTGKAGQQLFAQPPKPRFASIAYDSPPQRLLFDLRASSSNTTFAPWSFTRAAALVEILRNAAAKRLKEGLTGEEAKIDRIIMGRNATEADKATRVRILPLPSIGHRHADRAIRRVLVEIPPNCPVRPDDIAWGFSGQPVEVDATTGEILSVLVPADERGMLQHYGIEGDARDGFHVWRTVTPIALPVRRAGGRIGGRQRAKSETAVAAAVRKALRHSGVPARVAAVRVQREPFEERGARVDEFAAPERLAARGLHHIEITFAKVVRGPLIIGDGRYVGLGLMAPTRHVWRDVMIFPLPPDPGIAIADTATLLHAVRRALMSLARNGEDVVPRLFSGHELDSAPARSGRHEHIFLACADLDGDGRIDRLVVAAPWACDHTMRARQEDRIGFDRVVSSLQEVRAGRLGVIRLDPPALLARDDALIGPAYLWESRTAYRPTRHAGRKDLAAAVMRDVITECERRGLPRPDADLLELEAGPNGGAITALLRLRFAVAVEGPIMLGRDCHAGGGLFGLVASGR